MDKGIMAARRQLALEAIERQTGPLIISKAPSTELRELFRLEAIAVLLEERKFNQVVEAPKTEEVLIVAETLARVMGISGVGPALEAKIQEEFKGLYDEAAVEA